MTYFETPTIYSHADARRLVNKLHGVTGAEPYYIFNPLTANNSVCIELPNSQIEALLKNGIDIANIMKRDGV